MNGPRRTTLRIARGIAVLVLLGVAAAHADWLQPDLSIRDQQQILRFAARDTVGHSDDVARLDSVAVALLRLAKLDDARRLFDRIATMDPADVTARAARGKLALFADKPAVAESLLAGLESQDPLAAADLFAARIRRGEFEAAAELAPLVNQEGRRELLNKLAERAPYEVKSGPGKVVLPFARAYPIALVRVKLNGQLVTMALDTGAEDLILDDAAFRHFKVQSVAGQSVVFWAGSRQAVKNAIVQKLELGGIKLENCPAGVKNLGRWSLEVNPQSERIAGVIGLNLLRRFTPTIDFEKQKLELRRPGTPWTPADGAVRVPFMLWGENELMVMGTFGEGRKMALIVQTGVPGCGVGATQDVFDEYGIRPGAMSKLTKGLGQIMQGRPWYAVTVPVVSVGPLAEDKVAAWSGALDPGELWRHGVRRDALLSNDFFRHRRMTIDWDNRELVFEGE